MARDPPRTGQSCRRLPLGETRHKAASHGEPGSKATLSLGYMGSGARPCQRASTKATARSLPERRQDLGVCILEQFPGRVLSSQES